MVGEFVPCRHSDSPWGAVVRDQVDGRDLGFFSAVFGMPGNGQRTEGRLHNRAIALVEPLRRDADLAFCRPPPLAAPLEHAHAIGHLRLFMRGGCNMHRLAVARAAQVRQAGSGDMDAMRVSRHVDGRKQLPMRLAAVNGVVAQDFVRHELLGDIRKRASFRQSSLGQGKNRIDVTQEDEFRLAHNCHAPLGANRLFEPDARLPLRYSMILNRLSDSSLTVRPSPGVFSSRSM